MLYLRQAWNKRWTKEQNEEMSRVLNLFKPNHLDAWNLIFDELWRRERGTEYRTRNIEGGTLQFLFHLGLINLKITDTPNRYSLIVTLPNFVDDTVQCQRRNNNFIEDVEFAAVNLIHRKSATSS